MSGERELVLSFEEVLGGSDATIHANGTALSPQDFQGGNLAIMRNVFHEDLKK